jgi:hypothetical protein
LNFPADFLSRLCFDRPPTTDLEHQSGWPYRLY